MHAIRPSWMPTSALTAPPPDPSTTSPPAERHVDHDRPLSKIAVRADLREDNT